jgi:hypothetical protein
MLGEWYEKSCKNIKNSLICFSNIYYCSNYTGTLNFNYDVSFSGDTPGGSAPYLTAIFDDTAAEAGWDVIDISLLSFSRVFPI